MEDQQEKQLSQNSGIVSNKAPGIRRKHLLKQPPQRKDFTQVFRTLCGTLQTSDFHERREVIIRVDRVQKPRGI